MESRLRGLYGLVQYRYSLRVTMKAPIVLGGSWVAISGVTSPLIWVITIVTLLITPLITTHEPQTLNPKPQAPIVSFWQERLCFEESVEHLGYNPAARHNLGFRP